MGKERANNTTDAIKKILTKAEAKRFDAAPSVSDPDFIDAYSKMLWVRYEDMMKGVKAAVGVAEKNMYYKRLKGIEEELRKLSYLANVTLNQMSTPGSIKVSVADPDEPEAPQDPDEVPDDK